MSSYWVERADIPSQKPITPPSEPSGIETFPNLLESTPDVETLDLPVIRLQPSIGSDATAVIDGSLTLPVHTGGASRVRSKSSHSNASSTNDRSDSDLSGEHKLRDSLRCAEKRCHPWRLNHIIPRSQLEALVTVAAVVEDIRARNPLIDLHTAQTYAERVCQCAKQLYAILAYLKRGADICPLLDEGITDADLPLVVTEKGEVELRKKDGQAIKTIAGWPERHRENFDKYQSTINAPVFNQDEHYDFDPCTYLPFIRLKECENPKGKEGGYSYVYPVRLHPDHHNFWLSESEVREVL